MTENEYNDAMKELVISLIAGLIIVYGFFITLSIFDIH